MSTIRRGLGAPLIALVAVFAALAPTAVTFAEGPPAAPLDPQVAFDAIDRESPADHIVTDDGRVHLRGKGTLVAHGRGSVSLAGDLRVVGSVLDARLVVIDHAGDATIRLNDRDRRGVTVDDRTELVIADFDGRFHIEGSRVEVRIIHGRNIDLWARGMGHAVLDGHGWLRVNGGRPYRWTQGF